MLEFLYKFMFMDYRFNISCSRRRREAARVSVKHINNLWSWVSPYELKSIMLRHYAAAIKGYQLKTSLTSTHIWMQSCHAVDWRILGLDTNGTMFYDLGMYGRDLNIGRGKRVPKKKLFKFTFLVHELKAGRSLEYKTCSIGVAWRWKIMCKQRKSIVYTALGDTTFQIYIQG